jgi:ribA/ribD-fused uncharacterized protein
MTDYTEHRPTEFKYKGKWIDNWFSNMTPVSITIFGITYKSVENYYQAMKTLDVEKRQLIADMYPSKAKMFGRTLTIREDWDRVKLDVMKAGLLLKFQKYPHKQQLLDTGNDMIIEWNNWNDTFWGVSITNNMGNNYLGLLLMQVRDELRHR